MDSDTKAGVEMVFELTRLESENVLVTIGFYLGFLLVARSLADLWFGDFNGECTRFLVNALDGLHG